MANGERRQLHTDIPLEDGRVITFSYPPDVTPEEAECAIRVLRAIVVVNCDD